MTKVLKSTSFSMHFSEQGHDVLTVKQIAKKLRVQALNRPGFKSQLNHLLATTTLTNLFILSLGYPICKMKILTLCAS